MWGAFRTLKSRRPRRTDLHDLGNCVLSWSFCKLFLMSAGKQRCSRTRMVLPLRVWLDCPDGETPVWRWAHTVDISPIGCRLGGLRELLSPGQTIILQRGQHRASFRVIWSHELEPNESQAGIEALDLERDIWGIELPPSKFATAAPAPEKKAETIATPATAAKPAPKAANRGPARKRWGFRLGLSFLGLFVAWLTYREVSYRYGKPEIRAQVPSVPSDRDLAPLRPRPHLPTLLARTVDSSASRVQVAEAPLGYVVYPVAPDDSIKGQVRLKVIIAANGIVKQIQALSGKPALAEAAARAVHFWRYSSFTGIDQVAERETTVTVNFVGGDAVSLEFPCSNAQLRAN